MLDRSRCHCSHTVTVIDIMDNWIWRMQYNTRLFGQRCCFSTLRFSPLATVPEVRMCLLPSALALGPESRIYSHKVRTYVRGGSRSGMSRGMLLHTIGIQAICESHSLTHSDMLDSDRWVDDSVLWRWRWRSGTTARRCHRGLDTTNTKQLLS